MKPLRFHHSSFAAFRHEKDAKFEIAEVVVIGNQIDNEPIPIDNELTDVDRELR